MFDLDNPLCLTEGMPEDVEAARATCARCPVLKECRALAVGPAYDTSHDIFMLGGLIAPERRDIVENGPAPSRLCPVCRAPVPWETVKHGGTIHPECYGRWRSILRSAGGPLCSDCGTPIPERRRKCDPCIRRTKNLAARRLRRGAADSAPENWPEPPPDYRMTPEFGDYLLEREDNV